MMGKILVLIFAVFIQLTLHSQYKLKHFKEGYVLKNHDTVHCKIFAGKDTEPCREVILKYTDSKFEEAITYGPGSIVKAYGYRVDTTVIDYVTIFRKKSGALSKKYETVFAKVLEKGIITLAEFSEMKYRAGHVLPTGASTGAEVKVTDFYIILPGKDTASNILSKGLFDCIDEEDLKQTLSDYPELVTRIGKKLTMSQLQNLIREYNSRYLKK